MTKGQKKMAGVIVLGGAALLVDRFVLSGPSAAEAGAAESLLVTSAEAGAKPGAPSTRPGRQGWGAQQVASRLAASYERNGRPAAKGDPFHAPVVIVPAAVAPVATPSEKPGITFARGHQLKAIMASGRRGSALLNDQLVHQGDIVSEWKVVEITGNTVLFERNGERVKLALSDPSSKLHVIK